MPPIAPANPVALATQAAVARSAEGWVPATLAFPGLLMPAFRRLPRWVPSRRTMTRAVFLVILLLVIEWLIAYWFLH